jgi:CHASE3 domain sensor protein
MSNHDRIEKFKADVESAQVKTSGNASAEKAAGTLGVVLMVVGLVLAIGMYVQASNEGVGDGTTNEILLAQMNQNQAMILAIAGVGMILLGGVLFLRASIIRFWRFWMLRSLYEQQAHLDEVVTAIKER